MARILLPLIACFLFASCGGSPEERSVEILEEMADVLADVKDKASAQAAVEKLKELQAEGEELSKEIDKENVPEELKKKGMAAMGRVQKELMRIMADEELRGALDSLDLR